MPPRRATVWLSTLCAVVLALQGAAQSAQQGDAARYYAWLSQRVLNTNFPSLGLGTDPGKISTWLSAHERRLAQTVAAIDKRLQRSENHALAKSINQSTRASTREHSTLPTKIPFRPPD